MMIRSIQSGLIVFLFSLIGGSGYGDEPVRLQTLEVVAQPVMEQAIITMDASRVDVVGARQITELGANDLAAALRRLPEVEISRYNIVGAYGGGDGGAVYVRGHGSGRPGADISTLVDGVPRLNGVWAHPLLDTLSVDIARRIDVYKTPQPVLYGNAAFAVIDIVPVNERREGYHGCLLGSLGTYNTMVLKAEQSGRFESANYNLVGSHRESDGHRQHSDGEVDMLFGRADYEVSDAWDLDALVYHTEGWANDPGPVGAVPPGRVEQYKTDATLYMMALRNTYDAAEGFLKAYVDDGHAVWKEWDSEINEPFDHKPDYNNYGLRARERISTDNDLSVTMGMDLDVTEAKAGDYYLESPEHSRIYEKQSFYNVAPYITVAQPFFNDPVLTPSAGIRYDVSRYFDNEWGLQGGLTCDFGGWRVFANVARAYNYPGAYASILYDGWGDADGWKELEAEEMVHAELGATAGISDMMKITVDAFYDDVDNALRFAAPPPRFANIGHYISRGVETDISMQLLDELNLFVGAAANDPTPSDTPNLPDWSFVSGGVWEPWPFMQLNMDYQYNGSHYVLNPRFNNEPQQVDGYHLLNARLAYKVASGNDAWRGEVFLLAENLLDEEYEYRPGYPMPGTTWSVGFEVEF